MTGFEDYLVDSWMKEGCVTVAPKSTVEPTSAQRDTADHRDWLSNLFVAKLIVGAVAFGAATCVQVPPDHGAVFAVEQKWRDDAPSRSADGDLVNAGHWDRVMNQLRKWSPTDEGDDVDDVEPLV